MKKENLYSIVMNSKSNEIKILSLKDRFTPVKLATELENLNGLELITVDWHRGIITKKSNAKDIIAAKNNINREKKNVPDYMKVNKTKINKPYI